ncbi:hypothetical protein Desti_4585 [Desulfomonile tiedjei DSM 6799]|uniref:Uncharacterized protein n=1 Tax=Desulfomonile tiedjei (strain ATCC 49306 / DSM 6799 / DCB-1) TaxID=706587 RepID=I4CCC1_DESTA|nr:hypothetical protein Desti_4585 [Desulfomonile tiedjei DSM 6799]
MNSNQVPGSGRFDETILHECLPELHGRRILRPVLFGALLLTLQRSELSASKINKQVQSDDFIHTFCGLLS